MEGTKNGGGGDVETQRGKKASHCPGESGGGKKTKKNNRALHCTHIRDFTSQEGMTVGGKTCAAEGEEKKIIGRRETSCPVNERERERCQNEIKRL